MASPAEQARHGKDEHPSTLKAWLKELGIIFGAFLLLNSFVLASFEVPTGSMENEIMTGDFLLVNKFIFGGTTPKTVPFTNTKLPSFKLPALWDVEKGDIIVFIFPGMREEVEARDFAYYLKRCIATAGESASAPRIALAPPAMKAGSRCSPAVASATHAAEAASTAVMTSRTVPRVSGVSTYRSGSRSSRTFSTAYSITNNGKPACQNM